MTPPQHITVVSDGNVLSFVEIKPSTRKNPDIIYVYQYTLSRTKLNELLHLTEKELTEMIRKNIVV